MKRKHSFLCPSYTPTCAQAVTHAHIRRIASQRPPNDNSFWVFKPKNGYQQVQVFPKPSKMLAHLRSWPAHKELVKGQQTHCRNWGGSELDQHLGSAFADGVCFCLVQIVSFGSV